MTEFGKQCQYALLTCCVKEQFILTSAWPTAKRGLKPLLLSRDEGNKGPLQQSWVRHWRSIKRAGWLGAVA